MSLYMSWQRPASMVNLGSNRDSRGTFEIGWKDIAATDECRSLNNARFAGFPANMEVRWDYTEDERDAVLWMADLDTLAADAAANPGKLYNASGICGSDQGYYTGSNTSRPYFQVQLGHWGNGVKDPATSFADASLNYIPAEEGRKAFPTEPGFEDRSTYTTVMYNAWNRDHSFEDGDAAWRTVSASYSRICNGVAFGGPCYVYVHPDNLGSSRTSWFYQAFQVENRVDRDGDGYATRFRLGNRTGLQVENAARCPVNSPRDSRQYSANCHLTIWIKTNAAANWQTQEVYPPADGRWYYGLFDGWSAQTTDDNLQVWIDTHGYPTDLDTTWVSSGI